MGMMSVGTVSLRVAAPVFVFLALIDETVRDMVASARTCRSTTRRS